MNRQPSLERNLQYKNILEAQSSAKSNKKPFCVCKELGEGEIGSASFRITLPRDRFAISF